MAKDKGVAKLLDAGIAAYLANIERGVIVAEVRQWELAGKTLEEMTSLLQAMAQESEAKAQKAIDDAPD